MAVNKIVKDAPMRIIEDQTVCAGLQNPLLSIFNRTTINTVYKQNSWNTYQIFLWYNLLDRPWQLLTCQYLHSLYCKENSQSSSGDETTCGLNKETQTKRSEMVTNLIRPEFWASRLKSLAIHQQLDQHQNLQKYITKYTFYMSTILTQKKYNCSCCNRRLFPKPWYMTYIDCQVPPKYLLSHVNAYLWQTNIWKMSTSDFRIINPTRNLVSQRKTKLQTCRKLAMFSINHHNSCTTSLALVWLFCSAVHDNSCLHEILYNVSSIEISYLHSCLTQKYQSRRTHLSLSQSA